MKRTTKAMARLGTLAVLAGTALSAPFAIGTANAAGVDLSAGDVTVVNGNITSKAEASTHAVYSAGQMATVTVAGDGVGVDPANGDNITLVLSGSHAYFEPALAGYTYNSATSVTCTVAGGACPTIQVGDDLPESVGLAVIDDGAGGTTQSDEVDTTVGFNAIQIQNCPTAGYETAINLPAPISTPINCATQGQLAHAITETIKYVAGGVGVANQTLTVAMLGGGTAEFTAVQPAGSQADSTVTPGIPPYDIVTCTTDANGECKVTFVDNSPSAGAPYTSALAVVTVTAPHDYPAINTPPPAPDQLITFDVGSVAPARIDAIGGKVIAPSSQDTAASPYAEPGDVLQGNFQVYGDCTVVAPAATCTGQPLANTTLDLTVDHGFFTPNCVSPASTSPTTLNNNNYANCTFNSAQADGTTVGDLKSSGTTMTVTTDALGQFTASLAIGKDAGFDDDGLVVVHMTAAGKSIMLPGDHNTNVSCAPVNVETAIPGAVVGSRVNGNGGVLPAGGCAVDGAWTTAEEPLNGGTAKLLAIPAISQPNNSAITTENNFTVDDTKTWDVPDADRVAFVIHMTDQFGNLTAGSPQMNAVGVNAEVPTLTKTGPGTVYGCTGAGGFTATNACVGPSTLGITPTAQPDGTVTQTITKGVIGSYNNLVSDGTGAGSVPNGQIRGQVDTGGPNTGYGTGSGPGVNDGTTVLTLSWAAPTNKWEHFHATTPATGNTVAGTAAAVTDTFTLNFYNQLAQPVVTFTVKPGSSVRTGTAVTAEATVIDQKGNPVVLQLVQFVRTGANESSCKPIQDTNANQGILTNTSGVAGYTFSCDSAGVSNVSMVVTGPGGIQLAQGREAITFTGEVVSGAAKTEKPGLKITSPRKHVLKLKATTHPSLKHVSVHFYKVNKHGKKHLVGADGTNKHGKAHILVKHLKSGKHYRFKARVVHLSTSKYKSKYSKVKSHKVK
jgi:hypothetical protein